jgi:N-terminal domain of NWD NACHT-NTPase
MALTEPLSASSAPAGSLDTELCSVARPPESLWDRAYEQLKVEQRKLIDQYEKFLSRELEKRNFEGSTSSGNIIEQTNARKRELQMETLVELGLQKIEGEEKVKQVVGYALQGVLSLKDIVNSALQAVPQAAIAWTGVCFSLQVRVLLRGCHNAD